MSPGPIIYSWTTLFDKQRPTDYRINMYTIELNYNMLHG